MNKKAEEAGGEAWSKIIKIILVIAVLVLVLFALFFGNIPGWLNNLLPDFFKTHTDNSALKLEQANISEMQKSLDCPSPDRAITLIYKGGKNDLFQVRYNTNLSRAQVYMWPNYYTNDLMISFYNNILGKEKSRKDSKEWLIYSDDKLNGMYDSEFRELKTILDASTKEVFIATIIDIVKKDKNLYIDLGKGIVPKDELVKEQDIINFLNDQQYLQEYEEDLKKASSKCNGKLEDNLKIAMQDQEKIPYWLKGLDCPSSDRSILLVYKGGLDDSFEVRFNKDLTLNRPQINIKLNFGANDVAILRTVLIRKPDQTKEWLIDPDLFDSFNKNKDFKLYDDEIDKIRHVMYSKTEPEFIQRISELSQESNWDVSFKTLNLFNKARTVDEISKGLQDLDYNKKYLEDLKTAPNKCKPLATTPAATP